MAQETRNALTAGKLTVFSEGEYSDYGYRGIYVALKDLTIEQLQEMVKPLKSKQPYDDDAGKVEALLIREGYLLEVDCTEVHLGSYREISPEIR